MTIQQNLVQILTKINAMQAPQKVKLLAVSKTKPCSAILQAYQVGQTAFGENYVQEGIEKIQWFRQQHIDLEWHFIGGLQSNKTRLVAEYFDWVQTIDRFKIAERLNAQRPAQFSPLNILIQINISDENSKSGIAPNELFKLAEQIIQLPNLTLRGLMAIPAPTKELSQQQETFQQMKSLFTQLQQHYPQHPIDTLSIGMSDDMQVAINCGSTMVRVGTAIFGSRTYI